MSENLEEINYKELAIDVFKHLKPYCISIYLGGSYCQDWIRNKGDVDFICFSDAPVNMGFIRAGLKRYIKEHKLNPKYDFIQVRTKQIEERSYGSYINKEMIKLVGETIEFKFDVIDKDRYEYINTLLDAVADLLNDRILNKKRWYQVLRGYYILLHRSYDLSEEEIDILNKIHDQEYGWEQYVDGLEDKLLELRDEMDSQAKLNDEKE